MRTSRIDDFGKTREPELSTGLEAGEHATDRSRRLGRLLGVGLLAGLVAGLVAGGLGSRVAMRIVALVAGHEHYGQITDAEETVGRITAGGTVFLLIAGAFFGVFGGFAYVIVQRWFPGRTIVKGVTFGVVLLIVVGTLVINGDNADFTRFVSPYLAVGLFAAIFVLFGLLVAVLVARFAGTAEKLPARPTAFAGWAGLVALVAYRLVVDVKELALIF